MVPFAARPHAPIEYGIVAELIRSHGERSLHVLDRVALVVVMGVLRIVKPRALLIFVEAKGGLIRFDLLREGRFARSRQPAEREDGRCRLVSISEDRYHATS